MSKKKINLLEEAEKSTLGIKEVKIPPITEEQLLERCPKSFLAAFKKAKTPGDRADFLKKFDDARKDLNRAAKEMEDFESGLKRWFIEQLPVLVNATGITGKVARVQIESKDKVDVTDWDAFYAWVRKNNAFEFFERKVKLSSAQDRWNAGKKIPGVAKGTYKTISLTKK